MIQITKIFKCTGTDTSVLCVMMMRERLYTSLRQARVLERVTWATAALCFFMSSFMSSWSSSMRDCRSFFSLCKRLSCSSSCMGIKQKNKTKTIMTANWNEKKKKSEKYHWKMQKNNSDRNSWHVGKYFQVNMLFTTHFTLVIQCTYGDIQVKNKCRTCLVFTRLELTESCTVRPRMCLVNKQRNK